jgi:hypothetical protein
VARAGVGGKPGFEFGHFRTEDVLAVFEHGGDAFVDQFARGLVLRFQVDEFHGVQN